MLEKNQVVNQKIFTSLDSFSELSKATALEVILTATYANT